MSGLPLPVCFYLDNPLGQYAEQIRRLRASLIVHLEKGFGVFLVSSCWMGEGKTQLCLDLSAALCEYGRRVLLVDADLRSRALSTTLDLRDPSGWVLETQAWLGRVDVIAAPSQERPLEFLQQPGNLTPLSSLLSGYDCVFLDSPSLSSCPDARVLVPLVDGVLMVASSRRFRGVAEGQFSEDLRDLGAKILGVVLTEV